MISTIAAIAYGILAFVGGIIGYAQAKSKMSLISGGISGVLLILCGVALQQGMVWAGTVAAIITAVLIVVFVMRLTKTRKFMPAGLMAIAGGAALAALLVEAFL